MDKHTTPPVVTSSTPSPRATVPPRASMGSDGEVLMHYRSTYMEPAGTRKFAPVIIVGAIAAVAMIGAGFMFDKEHADDALLARGPAVEALVENAPPAAGPTDAASAVVESAAPAAQAVTPEPLAAPAAAPRVPAVPAQSERPNRSVNPLPSPNGNDTIRPPMSDQPMRPIEPRVTEPVRPAPPAPSLETPPLPLVDVPPQPPATEPPPAPAPAPAPVPPSVPPIQ